jgi:holo-[acyl-carrier protein] synthase
MIVGLGVDICSVQRMAQVTERHGQRFLDRVLSSREQAALSTQRVGPERVAARFAAKEALMKALGTGRAAGVGFLDIHVLNHESGRPLIDLTGRAAEVAAALGVQRVHVSMSHEREHAVAVVLLEGETP